MPEGDTIYRSARAMRDALAGHEVTAFSTTVQKIRALGPERLVGQTVADVEPRGKNLLHWFEPSDLALHTHMRMTGSWHLYAPGERWRKPPRWAKVVLETAEVVAVCFSAPVCELLSRGQVDRHPSLAGLGPDALDEQGPDLAESARRLDALGPDLIGEALLDQRVLAGVGNVYKNEVLFIHKLDPWTRVADVDEGLRAELLATATKLLRANVAPGSFRRITTTDDPARSDTDRVYVYGKGGRPCPRCMTPIRVASQGRQARLTYWCPRCQGPGPRPSPLRSA